MKAKFTSKATNSVEPPAPTSVWGYKGCAGKGGKTNNSIIINKTDKKEND
jgi:hypothetical protein